jgi:hypothetical protein
VGKNRGKEVERERGVSREHVLDKKKGILVIKILFKERN